MTNKKSWISRAWLWIVRKSWVSKALSWILRNFNEITGFVAICLSVYAIHLSNKSSKQMDATYEKQARILKRINRDFKNSFKSSDSISFQQAKYSDSIFQEQIKSMKQINEDYISSTKPYIVLDPERSYHISYHNSAQSKSASILLTYQNSGLRAANSLRVFIYNINDKIDTTYKIGTTEKVEMASTAKIAKNIKILYPKNRNENRYFAIFFCYQDLAQPGKVEIHYQTIRLFKNNYRRKIPKEENQIKIDSLIRKYDIRKKLNVEYYRDYE